MSFVISTRECNMVIEDYNNHLKEINEMYYRNYNNVNKIHT